MKSARQVGLVAATFFLTVVLVACGGDGFGPGGGQVAPANATYRVAGTVTGLANNAGLVLRLGPDSSNDTVNVSGSGQFQFASGYASSTRYEISIVSQPDGHTCTVLNGSGQIGVNNVTDVRIACTTDPSTTYTIGGQVSGLTGSLVLQNHKSDSTTISSNGAFTMATPVFDNAAYQITVATQPVGQTCAVVGGAGTVQSANIKSIAVACQNNPSALFTLGGSISGLGANDSVMLQNAGSGSVSSQTFSSNGPFALANAIAPGSTYNVQVATAPSGKTCTVTNPSGIMGIGNVSNITVSCSGGTTYSVSATITGINAGTAITLSNNGSDLVTSFGNDTVTFPTQLAAGSSYAVSVNSAPTGQVCSVANGSGTVTNGDVTNIAVLCKTNPISYSIGGVIRGLFQGLGISLTNIINGVGSVIVVQGNGNPDGTNFQFPANQVSNSVYNVAISTQPYGQNCTLYNGTGTVQTGDVTNITVNCYANTAPTYTVGGTVLGLNNCQGCAVTLYDADNGDIGSSSITVAQNGSFTMPIALQNFGGYNVKIYNQPANQSCSLINSSGAVTGANANNIIVNCSNVIASYQISVPISGLAVGDTIQFQNAFGGKPQTYSCSSAKCDTNFTLPQAVAVGAPYNVIINSEPANKTCVVGSTAANPSIGTMPASNISIPIACTTNAPQTIGGTLVNLDVANGASVTLMNNGGDYVTLTSNGPFTFPTPVMTGQSYQVGVQTAPSSPTNAYCVLTNSGGTVGTTPVSNVGVDCGHGLSVLSSFAKADSVGYYPGADVTIDSNGNVFGVTASGGDNLAGSVFMLSPVPGGGWNMTTLHSFNFTDGSLPVSALTIDNNGHLYGTTTAGGANHQGTLFELTNTPTGWTFQTLLDFSVGDDQGNIFSTLLMDSIGNLYGTSKRGGATGNGFVFKLTNPANNNGVLWTEEVLYNFTGGADGGLPYGGVIMDQMGNLFGTTLGGGLNSQTAAGVVFQLAPPGSFGNTAWVPITIYTFQGLSDGANPMGGLIMDSAGNLYGTTPAIVGYGNVFKLTKNGGGWNFSNLYSFTGQPDGDTPYGKLAMDQSGNLYGVAARGGVNGMGMIFKLVPSGLSGWSLAVLHSFGGGAKDGAYPSAGITLDQSGNLYGTTDLGGANSGGTVFKLGPVGN